MADVENFAAHQPGVGLQQRENCLHVVAHVDPIPLRCAITMKLERIIEGLFLGPSQHSIGLQCADLLTAIATSAERGNGQARGYLEEIVAAQR